MHTHHMRGKTWTCSQNTFLKKPSAATQANVTTLAITTSFGSMNSIFQGDNILTSAPSLPSAVQRLVGFICLHKEVVRMGYPNSLLIPWGRSGCGWPNWKCSKRGSLLAPDTEMDGCLSPEGVEKPLSPQMCFLTGSNLVWKFVPPKKKGIVSLNLL